MIDKKLSAIRLVITDVDGVLTDGSLYYGADGETLKRFNAHDGLGVRLLQHVGVVVAVISGRTSLPLSKRMTDLDILHFRVGVADKGTACAQLLAELQTPADQAIFIGDDLIDLPGFRACGLSATVANAPTYIRSQASLVLKARGGEGAFRELADAVLQAKGYHHLFTSGLIENKKGKDMQ